ncbi:MAG: sensor histidine kinase [Streptosporangiaceae bacterium]
MAGSTLAWLIAGLAVSAALISSIALVQARRATRRALGERGWLLERERQIGAEAAVDAERSRIARELHDIVSHNVSLMVVQANAAREVMAAAQDHAPTPPDANQALQAVETAGRGALTELRNLLGLLASSSADGEGGDDLAPQPSLDRLSGLVDRVAFAGLPVEVRISGEPRPLPAGVDVTAYRIVQEALTNALKHGQATAADVTIRYAEHSLRVEVLNTGPSVLSTNGHVPLRPKIEHKPGNGRGLLGLRERVAVYGGEFDARRRLGGGFRVRARIPLDQP